MNIQTLGVPEVNAVTDLLERLVMAGAVAGFNIEYLREGRGEIVGAEFEIYLNSNKSPIDRPTI